MSLPTAIIVSIAQRIALSYPRLTVLQERKGDIEAKIAAATSSLGDADHYAGIVCVLETPSMRPTQGEGHGGEMVVTFPITLFEQPLLNDDAELGSAKDVLTWGLDLMELLNNWQIGILFPNPPTLRLGSNAGQSITSPDVDGTGYRIDLVVDASLFAKRRARRVFSAVIDGELHLSTKPTNSRIYYSTSMDWDVWPNMPGPTVAGATLYTAPVAISDEGMTLIATSYGVDDDWIPGDLMGWQKLPADKLTDGDAQFISTGDGGIIQF